MSEEKTRRYLVINENGKVEHFEMPFKKKWSLEELQEKVEGYIESINVKINGKKYHGYHSPDGAEKIHLGMNNLVGPIIVENFKGDEKAV